MRQFQILTHVATDEADQTLHLSGEPGGDSLASLWFGHEGMYVSVSANYGPLEISLRPRQRDLVASLAQLKPTERLSIMRMIGTGQAHLAVGLSQTGKMLLRTSIVADATGQFAMNFILEPDVRAQLFTWLGVKNPALV